MDKLWTVRKRFAGLGVAGGTGVYVRGIIARDERVSCDLSA